jgi:F-type H+-transporting ATPase subunit delta
MALAVKIANRYAEALYSLAKECGAEAAWEGQLAALAGILAHTADLLPVLIHPEVPIAQKETVLNRAFSGKLAPEILTTLSLLLRRGHEPDAEALHAGFLKLWNHDRNVLPAVVTSAVPLSPAQAESLATVLARRTGATIQLTQRIDPTVLAGLVVHIGDRVIDASASTTLQHLHATMRGA